MPRALFGSALSRTNAVETLLISCRVRGLSERDVEAILVDGTFGEGARTRGMR